MPAHLALREATAADHARVDDAFATYALATEDGYRRFLRAHGRALPAVEDALARGRHAGGPPPLRPRTSLLADDLADLGSAMPGLLPLAAPAGMAAAWGMAYVIEGSRLGGGLLARAVPPGAPSRYLGDTHHRGEWRGFLAMLDAALADTSARAEAAAAARGVFDLYLAAARDEVATVPVRD